MTDGEIPGCPCAHPGRCARLQWLGGGLLSSEAADERAGELMPDHVRAGPVGGRLHLMIVQKASVCPLDCPDTCSLAVSVADEHVLAVRGSKANPLTHGAVCAKVAQSYPEFVHGANRVRFPQRRIGPKGAGRFERISWDDALELIHTRVTEVVARYGSGAVLPLNYAGPHGMLAGDSMSLRFFHRLGASFLSRSPLCGGIRSTAYAATFGATPGKIGRAHV